jgi:uncharacterized protein
MKRKDKEITDIRIIESILLEADICRIALSDNNIPYIVPMNFGYSEKTIYLHSIDEGKKIDIIKNNNNICFETESKTSIVKSENPCNWGMKYLSVIGYGKAYFINDFEEKTKALNIIMNKYSGTSGHQFAESQLHKPAVIKIMISEMAGKKSGY